MSKSKKDNRNRKLIIRIIIVLLLLLLLIKGCSLVRDEYVKSKGKEIFNIKCNKKNCIQLLEVNDNNSKWKSNTLNEIDLFNTNYIKPEDHGSYRFSVNNNIKKQINYSIKLMETNPKDINLKYKLKQNNKYINKDWMDADKIVISNSRLFVNDKDNYVLEWKWVSNKNDNDVAGLIDKYQLRIQIDAEA